MTDTPEDRPPPLRYLAAMKIVAMSDRAEITLAGVEEVLRQYDEDMERWLDQ